jgi:phosphocarrier protein HPr
VENSERSCVIRNRLGLHLRAANKLVRVASRFESDIWLAKEDLEVDAKSIMGLTLLAASCGSQVTVRARGMDAKEAVDAVGALIESRFEEEE